MRAVIILPAILAALTAAAPEVKRELIENVTVSGLKVLKSSGDIKSSSFKLDAGHASNVDCSAGDSDLPEGGFPCSNPDYRFAILPAATGDGFGINILYEANGELAVGGHQISAVCKTAASGPDDFVCTQTSPATWEINSN